MYAHFDSQKYTGTTQKLYIIYISYCGYPIELVGTHICMWVPTYSVAIYICFNMYNYK